MDYTKQDVRDRVCARSGVGEWSNQHADTTAAIDDAISDAIRFVSSHYQVPDLETSGSVSATSGSPFVNLPSDFDGFLTNPHVCGYTSDIQLKSPAEMAILVPNAATDLGRPFYASEYGSVSAVASATPGVPQMWLGPTPDATYVIEFNYQKLPDDFAATSFATGSYVRFNDINPVIWKAMEFWRTDDAVSKQMLYTQRFEDSVRLLRARQRIVRRTQIATIDDSYEAL
jgi:hypothetical protein